MYFVIFICLRYDNDDILMMKYFLYYKDFVSINLVVMFICGNNLWFYSFLKIISVIYV